MLNTLDRQYVIDRMSWRTRWLLKLFAKRLNRELVGPVFMRLHEGGHINSHAMHALLSEFDPDLRGVVGRVWAGWG